MKFPEWARGWLAGLIDGEGTITVRYLKRRDGSRRYQPIIVISNKERRLLEKVQELIGHGRISSYGKYHIRRHPNWSQVYRLEIKGSRIVLEILQSVYPYLVIKRKQAELVMKICEINLQSMKKRKRNDELRELVKYVKLLNKRGSLPPEGCS